MCVERILRVYNSVSKYWKSEYATSVLEKNNYMLFLIDIQWYNNTLLLFILHRLESLFENVY